jgi:hypothetical protein
MRKLRLVTSVTTDISHQVALHRIAVTESAVPILEGAAPGCDIPGAVGFWAPEGVETAAFWMALERVRPAPHAR